MIKANAYANFWAQLLFLVTAMTLFSTCQPETSLLNLSALETELYQRTNTLRQAQQLPPLQPLEILSTIARAHSKDMADRRFFEHINPEGLAPHERLMAGLPNAVNMYSGENLAQHSQDNLDTSALATELMRLWIASPEHLAQLTAPDFRHLGVGIFQDEAAGILYATQTFATLVAQLTETPPEIVAVNTPFSLSFTFFEAFPREELTAFLHTSNGFSPIEGPNGVFYKGKGPVSIKWVDNTHFTIRIPTELGAGRYRLRLGQNGRSFEKEFVVNVS